MGLLFAGIFLWGLFWLVGRGREYVFRKLPSWPYALIFLIFTGMAIFATLLTLVEYDAGQARAGLPAITTLAELRSLPARTEIALVGRVSRDLPLTYYEKFVVYTEHGNSATLAMLSGAAALKIALPDGDVEFANVSYRIAGWHVEGVDASLFGLMRDDPVVVHAIVTRAGEDYIPIGPQSPGDRVTARFVMMGTHDDYVIGERGNVWLYPYIAIVLGANALAWAVLSVGGILAVRRRSDQYVEIPHDHGGSYE